VRRDDAIEQSGPVQTERIRQELRDLRRFFDGARIDREALSPCRSCQEAAGAIEDVAGAGGEDFDEGMLAASGSF
jgi:hypothetical protein